MANSKQVSDLVFDYITENISSGKWVPGMKIETEEQLCANLNVSRIAVRQAIEKLAALSVLKKVQGSGTYVTPFEESSLSGLIYYPTSPQTMLTVLEFRRMFDSYNAELFIQHATPEELESLEENYNKMIACRDDPQQFQCQDNRFHHLIAQGTHNVMIRQISNTFMELLERYQAVQYDKIGPDHAIKWHGLILEAIRDGDPELARVYARIHIDNSIRRIQEESRPAEQKICV